MVTALVMRQALVTLVMLQAMGAIGVTVRRERQLVSHGEQPLPGSTYLALLLRLPLRALGVYLIAPTAWAFTSLWSTLGYLLVGYLIPVVICFVIETLVFALIATLATRRELKKQAEKIKNADSE